jgi:hypothetical protein
MKPSPSKSMKTTGGKKRSQEEAAGSGGGSTPPVSLAPESQQTVEEIEGQG